MPKVTRTSDIRTILTSMQGKKIQVVTANGQKIRGTVQTVGKDFVVINGYRVNDKGVRTSSVFFPFFFPFSFFFFTPFFF
jgi:hypothetical protein